MSEEDGAVAAARCANGHAMGIEEVFCGRCGAPSEADLLSSDPEWAKEEPTPAAAACCPAGHENPGGNAFCAVCGAPIAPITITSSPTASGHPLRGVAIAAVAVLLVVGGILLMTRRDTDSTSSPDRTAVHEATTTSAPEDACIREISAWLAYVTSPGASLTDAAAEYGIQSSGYQMVEDAWQSWNANVYRVGRDEAAHRVDALIATQCGGQLGQGYEPGHMPPS